MTYKEMVSDLIRKAGEKQLNRRTKVSELLADCYLAGYLDTAFITINGEVYEMEVKDNIIYVKDGAK